MGAVDGSGGNASDGEPQLKLFLLARLQLTSCCAAQFLIGCGPVAVRGPAVGDPYLRGSVYSSVKMSLTDL